MKTKNGSKYCDCGKRLTRPMGFGKESTIKIWPSTSLVKMLPTDHSEEILICMECFNKIKKLIVINRR